MQLGEQENQIATLRSRISTLEGREDTNAGQRLGQKAGGTSVDDWSIKVSLSIALRLCMLIYLIYDFAFVLDRIPHRNLRNS